MKRGFFFSIVSLVLLIYIFSSLSYKMESVREQSKNYKENIRLASHELIYSQLSKKNIEDYLKVVSYYALIKMADHTAEHPIKDNPGDELANVKSVFAQLFEDGSSSPAYFSDGVPLTYTSQEKESRTFSGLRDKFSRVLGENGLTLKTFQSNILSLEMKDPYTVKVSGSIKVEVEDSFGTSSFSYEEPFEVEVDIEGFPDPLVNRYLKGEGLDGSYERYIFKPTDRRVYKKRDAGGVVYYDFPEPETKGGAIAGRSWFYGRVFEVNEISDTARVPPSKRKYYILSGLYNDIKDKTEFGAYIYTDNPSDLNSFLSQITHDKPFIVYPGFKKSDLNYDQATDPGGELAVLFVSEKDGIVSDPAEIKIYKIEYFRDAVICSYYFSPYSFRQQKIINVFSGDSGAPSFLQRMLVDAYKRSDPVMGLTSFLVGTEFGGSESLLYSDNSKLDFEFVGQYFGNSVGSVYSIRGLPACKSKDMCSINDPLITGVAEIRVSGDNLDEMWGSSSSVVKISCREGSSCE